MHNLLKKSIALLTAFAVATPSFAALPASTYGYDGVGRLAQIDEGNGQRHAYSYTAWDTVGTYNPPHPTSSGATLGEVSFGYGSQQRLISVTDARGLQTSYTLDPVSGETRSVTSPDTGYSSFTYDSAGNLTGAVAPSQAQFSFGYDALNRRTSANYGDVQVTWGYHASGYGAGQLATMQDSSGSTSWTYDAYGHSATRTQVTSGPGGGAGATLTVAQNWDSERLLQRQYPSGNVVTFTYDAENVTSISVNGTTVISNITRQPFGMAASWQMGSVGTYSRTFDTAGRIASYTYDSGQRVVGWDASNRVTSIQNPGGVTWTYGYDNLNRMTSSAEGALGSQGYAFDATGNRTSKTEGGSAYAYGVDSASNKLTTSTGTAGSRSYQYGAGGFVISDGLRTFTWTNAGQLASAAVGASTATYSYNGFGQRVRKVVGAAARHYVYDEDGVSLLGEYVQPSSGAAVTPLNEVVYLDGVPVLVMRGSSVYYVQPDHLGTPRTIRDTAGTVVWSWVSDAFGNGAPNQNPGGVSLFEFNSRMPGQQFDAETGLFYNNARYYDATTGRYVSSDPIGLRGGLNVYAYAAGAPQSATDPTGNLTWLLYGGARIFTWALANPVAATSLATGIAEAGLMLATGTPAPSSMSDVFAGAFKAAKMTSLAIGSAEEAASMAQRLAGLWNGFAQNRRTVAVLGTSECTLASAGAVVNMTGQQNKLATALGAIPVGAGKNVEGLHAEMKLLQFADDVGETALYLGASRRFCPNCQRSLVERGWAITSPTTAVKVNP